MVEQGQSKPLAPAATHRPSIDNDNDNETALPVKKTRPHTKSIKFWSYIVAIILIISITIIILYFTIFRVKNPIIKMNGFTVTKLELVNGTTIPKPGVNISLNAELSVKNPNRASFKYSNTTTTLYYHGTVVGEARGPPGQAKARRTAKMNVTVDIITDKVTASPNLSTDVGSGLLTVSSYSRIGGRVKILKIIKKHVVVKMNCTLTFNISSRAIQEQKCKRRVDL